MPQWLNWPLDWSLPQPMAGCFIGSQRLSYQVDYVLLQFLELRQPTIPFSYLWRKETLGFQHQPTFGRTFLLDTRPSPQRDISLVVPSACPTPCAGTIVGHPCPSSYTRFFRVFNLFLETVGVYWKLGPNQRATMSTSLTSSRSACKPPELPLTPEMSLSRIVSEIQSSNTVKAVWQDPTPCKLLPLLLRIPVVILCFSCQKSWVLVRFMSGRRHCKEEVWNCFANQAWGHNQSKCNWTEA